MAEICQEILMPVGVQTTPLLHLLTFSPPQPLLQRSQQIAVPMDCSSEVDVTGSLQAEYSMYAITSEVALLGLQCALTNIPAPSFGRFDVESFLA
jgi:hypothetical protein